MRYRLFYTLDTDDVIDMDTDQTADPVNVNSRSDNTYLQEPGSSSQGYNPYDRGYNQAVEYFQQLNQIQKPKEYE
ncbi:hypothetical protein JTE90_026792 [Oedothorax gibbosus]|uniref:Uncharacterized protein n=1 Tax=Oedothorax gibbosus TaxID=931172 RepID=A0AAV6URN6_9ARAC|nr:hypothetical protein JTE90_026792 [Oedothorax gibbosus]